MEYKYIFLIFLVINFQYSSPLSIKHTCESLSFRTGVDIQCENPITQESVDCQNEHVPIGTLAKYKCEDFFVSSNGEKEGGQMRCAENGKWMPDRKFRAFSCHMECGKSYPDSTNTQWPWHVSIFARESRHVSANFKFACGGTLINPFNAELLILTSTECLRNRNSDDLQISMGLTSISHDAGAEIFLAKTIMIDEDGLLALIQLTQQPVPSKNILPACLNLSFNFAKSQLQASAVGQLVGFGEGTDVLRNTSLEIVPIGKCIDSRSRIISKHSFCAGSEKSTNICSGDFGGGILLPSHFANSERQFLHGVLGDGIRNCKNYAWFIGLSEYADWIQETALTLHEEFSNEPLEIENHLPVSDFRENEVKTTIIPQEDEEPTATLPTATLPSSTLSIATLPIATLPTATLPSSTLPIATLPTVTFSAAKLSIAMLPASDEESTHHFSLFTNIRFIEDYEAAGVEFHNQYRKRHGVPPVTLSRELSSQAQKEAEAFLITSQFKFEGFTNWYGLSDGHLPLRQLVQEAVRDWYKTSSSFNWDFPKALPFTQIVWRRTTEIGIGVAQRGSKQVVVVKYNRPMVISSQNERSFQENVLRPVKPESLIP